MTSKEALARLEEENGMLKAKNYIYNLENIQLKQDISLILNNQDGLQLEYDKQQKLLELYKRLNKVQTLLAWYKIHTINRDKIEKYEREVFDITKQIKELENDK